MADLVFRLVVSADGTKETFERLKGDLEELKKQVEDPSELYIMTTDAGGNLRMVQAVAEETRAEVEKPSEIKISAADALATMRDVKIAMDGVISAFKGVSQSIVYFMDMSLEARQSMQLAKVTFGEAAEEMSEFAGQMQNVTNFGDDELLALMAKLSQTFSLTKEEIKALTPALLDFTEANKSTGMTIETAFNLFGRAMTGNTAMLARFGIQLDDSRLAVEGVSYLVEKLGEDFGGTAEALVDLRLQNANTWGDIKEVIGDMLTTMLTPLMEIVKRVMAAFFDLSPAVQGVVVGLVAAVPVIITVTTSVTALTAAWHALKLAMNPIAGVIGLTVGALTAVAFGVSAAIGSTEKLKEETESYAEAQKRLNNSIAEVETNTLAEMEKFGVLSSRLLELRGRTNLTVLEKRELSNVIDSLNGRYGEYLGNVDLERASYESLSRVLSEANDQLYNKMILAGQTSLLERQSKALADAKWKLSRALNENMNWNVSPLAANLEFAAEEALKVLEQRFLEPEKNPVYIQIKNLYQDVVNEASLLNSATEQYAALTKGVKPSGGGGRPSLTTVTDRDKEETRRLIEEMAKMRKTETELIEAEYKRRETLIKEHTKKGSDEQKAALEDLNEWKKAKENEITQRETEGVKAAFEREVQHLANLQELGVSNYDTLKNKMQEYYTWAKENLTAEEAAVIQLQMQEANLRWGAHQKEKEDRERAHQRTLADIRREWGDSNLSEDEQQQNAEMVALERYFEDKRSLMLEAGMTELEITEYYAAKMAEITEKYNEKKAESNERYVMQATSGMSKTFGQIAGMQKKETKRGFKTWKAMAIAQGMVDTFSAAIGAYRAMAGIPVVGPGLAVAAAAAALFAGVANVDNISKMEYEPPEAATGGYLQGPSHSGGGVVIEAEGGEYITNKRRVRELGKGVFDFINYGPLDIVRGLLRGMGIPAYEYSTVMAGIPDGGGSYSFAGGGYVHGDNAVTSLLGALDDKLGKLLAQKIGLDIHIDPLDANPVRVSEIADAGKLIRSKL